MKKLILSLAGMLIAGIAAGAAPITISLVESDTFKGMNENEEVVNMTLEGVDFSFKYCKNYPDYLMVCGKEHPGEAYFEFTAPVAVEKFSVTTGTGASDKVHIDLTCNGELIEKYSNLQIPKNTTFTFSIPADKQAAGVVYRIATIADEKYNAQYKEIVLNPEEGETPVDPDPITPDDPTDDDAIYSGLKNNANDWAINVGEIPAGLDYVWAWDDKYGLKASAYVKSVRYATDIWAVSPVIDLNGYNEAELAFSQAVNYINEKWDLLTVAVREENGEWTPITVAPMPAGNNWTFVDSAASLEEYLGKKIEIGFNYTSTEEDASTWEIKNLKVTGKKSTGVAEVEAEEAPVYYNLHGVKVANPENGLFIRIANGKATKVLVK